MELQHIILLNGQDIKSSADIAQLGREWTKEQASPSLVLCTAFGDTAQHLAALTQSFFDEKEDVIDWLDQVRNLHNQWAVALFAGNNHPIFDTLSNLLVEIEWILEDGPVDAYDYTYDQITAVGPLLSSTLLSAYLADLGRRNHWVDARNLIWTDNNHRHALIDHEKSKAQIQTALPPFLDQSWIVTQAGIGTTSENFSTTLGENGAQKSAQFIAKALGIKEFSAAPSTATA